MSSYNTGNPLGSTDPRDLYDNAQVIDDYANSDSATTNDRLGNSRRTLSGMESEFDADQSARESEYEADKEFRDTTFDADQEDRKQRFNLFLANSGYQFLGDYAAGIEINEYNEVVRDTSGNLWRASTSTELTYTTTGAGLPEGGAFVPIGDADLRQDLINEPGNGRGALLVRGSVIYVDTIAELLALPTSELVDRQQVQVQEYHAGTGVGGGEFYWDVVSTDANNGGTTLSVSGVATGRWKRVYNSAPVNICWFGAIGDGVQRRLSDLYSTFSDAQKHHPSAVDFEDQVDSTAIQCAIDAHNQIYVPVGLFWQNRAVIRTGFSGDLLICGEGSSSIVRRVPLTVDGSGGWNRMFNVSPAGDGEHHAVTVSNISLDHDASNQSSPETSFGFEQSGVFRVVAVGKESVSVYASNVFFNDPVADCLNIASGSALNTFKTISVDKVFNSKRTRRRFDVTITASYRTATIQNCDVTSLRWEINERDLDLPHDTLISNCRVALSREPGAGGNAMYVITAPLSKTQITNCNIKGSIYFGGGADFLISNIDVEDKEEDPVCRLLSGSFNFINSNFKLGSSGDACLYSDGGNTSPSGVTFNQCNFEFYGESANGNIRLRIIEPNPVKFVNCKIEQTSITASRVIDNDNAGGLIIDGCTIVRQQADASKSGVRQLDGDIEIKDSSFVGDIHWLKPSRRNQSISITGSTFSNNEKIFNNTGEDGSLLLSDFASTRVDGSDLLQTPELGLLRGTALPTAGVWLPGWEFQVVTATSGEDYKFVSTTRSSTPTWHAIGKLGA